MDKKEQQSNIDIYMMDCLSAVPYHEAEMQDATWNKLTLKIKKQEQPWLLKILKPALLFGVALFTLLGVYVLIKGTAETYNNNQVNPTKVAEITPVVTGVQVENNLTAIKTELLNESDGLINSTDADLVELDPSNDFPDFEL